MDLDFERTYTSDEILECLDHFTRQAGMGLEEEKISGDLRIDFTKRSNLRYLYRSKWNAITKLPY